MKAAYIEQTGPPENIRYADLPTPKPTGSQVLVKVGAVALNPVDTYIRAGMIPFELPMPFVVGCDLAGTVEAIGPNATRFRSGDRVWGTNQGLLGRQGTFSEFVAVDEQWLYPTPEGVNDPTAAAVSLVGITAHLGTFRDAKLQSGETLFVHGGSGGVGSCVVQMAKAAGARVITSAGSDSKADLCRRLGADLVIPYKTQDEATMLREAAPDGIDVWFETLREQDFETAVDLLAPRGRMVVMAGRDAKPPFPVGPFYVKDCKLFGFAMFNATGPNPEPDFQSEPLYIYRAGLCDADGVYYGMLCEDCLETIRTENTNRITTERDEIATEITDLMGDNVDGAQTFMDDLE